MTSIEWLISQLNKQGFAQVVTDEEIQQAKEMHKAEKESLYTEEEFKKAVIDAYHINPQEAKWKNIGINYYNETYGSKGSAESQGYICPQTKKQCKDECCVSAENCHIQAGIGVIFDCKDETTSSQKEASEFDKPFMDFAKQYFKPKKD